jgi:hypothetical protein
MNFYLPESLTLCNQEKRFFHIFKILWESASRSPFSSFRKLIPGWKFLLNLCISLHRSLLFLFLIFLEGINYVFQIFPLFIPEMSAGLTSYIVQIIPIYFT